AARKVNDRKPPVAQARRSIRPMTKPVRPTPEKRACHSAEDLLIRRSIIGVDKSGYSTHGLIQ
ncbi:MAG: hypothetical protein NT172_09080, partial [Planctomycetota bacterium]|nr:hypothetical protein [Planctomycetota bacterium]